MKCLVDNQLPPALARFLENRGVEAKHVMDIGLAQAADARIWRTATEGDYVLISKDQDFLSLAVETKGPDLFGCEWVIAK